MWNSWNAVRRLCAGRGARRRTIQSIDSQPGVVQVFEERLLFSGRNPAEPSPADPALAGPGFNPIVAPLPTDLDLSQTFQLSSRPAATKTIFLDFDGHTTSKTYWNSKYARGANIVTPPYSIDTSPEFNDVELATMQCIWQRVAEDFAPFDINVTTIEPPSGDLIRYGAGDDRWGMRVNIGGAYTDWLRVAAGGIAVRSSFGQAQDVGAFVFTRHRLGEEKYTADCISHEVGHTLGLGHKGAPGMTYYSGHGAGDTGWAPLMGAAYNRALSQWSKGEFQGTTSRQDELQVITTGKGVNYRADDYGSSHGTASALPFANIDGDVRHVSISGVIERNIDRDVFAFATTGGQLALDFLPAARGANLDLLAQIYNEHGELVATSNPAERIDARLEILLAPGVYYVMVDGVGARGLSDGYSDYGSLGQYTIEGTIAGSGLGSAGDPVAAGWIAGTVWHDADGNGVIGVNDHGLEGIAVFLDQNSDGVFDPAIEQSARTNPHGRYLFSGLAAAEYHVLAVFPDPWRQVAPGEAQARSVVISGAELAHRVEFSALVPPMLIDSSPNVSIPLQSRGTRIADQALVQDPDTTAFAGARLTIQLTHGSASTDRLFLLATGNGAGQVSLSRSSVRFGGRVIGTIKGGSGAVPLTVTFNSSASLAAIEAVLRALAYRTTVLRPMVLEKTLAITLTEPSGATSHAIEKTLTLLTVA